MPFTSPFCSYQHVLSNEAQKNSLFFVKGAAFKKEFLLSAIEQGLGWYVAEQDYEVGIPVIVVSDIKKAMSLIAMEFYGNPQEKLKLLAFLISLTTITGIPTS